MKTFTIFWNYGKATIVTGPTVEKALLADGYLLQHFRDISFYEEGTTHKNYKYDWLKGWVDATIPEPVRLNWIAIEEISNYYGYLHIAKHEDKCYWVMENHDNESSLDKDAKEISKELYELLLLKNTEVNHLDTLDVGMTDIDTGIL